MGIFVKTIFTDEKKREDLLLFLETQLKQLKEDYEISIEFLEENRTLNGFDEMIKELKNDYVTELVFLNNEIHKNIHFLRERVDKINKDKKWMNSKQSIDNMEGLNRTVGKLLALSEEVEKTKSSIKGAKVGAVVETKETEQPGGPQ